MTNCNTYCSPDAGLAVQTSMATDRAIVRSTHAIIPASSLTDNICSILPGWAGTRCWLLAAPAIGFATGFAQYLIYLECAGGCDEAGAGDGVESFVFVLDGDVRVTFDGESHLLSDGGFAFLPAGTDWCLRNCGAREARLLWIRKRYEILGAAVPAAIIGNEADIAPRISPTTDAVWATNLIPVNDIAYDMHVNIVSFAPGGAIPRIEMHVMEHGLYMLQGKGVYLLNDQWNEVKAADFIWMRAFCPQAFYAGGPIPARYLLYKNVNRQVPL